MSRLKCYDGLPKFVRVGCYIYAIEVMEESDSESAREFGHCNFISRKIRVAAGMTSQEVANTFIHEVMHAIHRFVGVNDESTEEQTTTLSANGLCAFWQDNPEACLWWAKTNASGRRK